MRLKVAGKRRRWILAVLVIAWTPAAAQRSLPDDRASLVQAIDGKRESYATIAKQIWGFAEVGYQAVSYTHLTLPTILRV